MAEIVDPGHEAGRYTSYTSTWNLATKEKLSIFTVSRNGYLTVRTWMKGEKYSPTNPDNLPLGPITRGSSIASVNLNSWTRVFGWAEDSNCRSGQHCLYMLSPVSQWIAGVKTEKENLALAAISSKEDDPENSWLYYIRGGKIREQNYDGVGNEQPSDNLIDKNTALLPGTRLAACMSAVGDNRSVAFQTEDGKIRVYDSGSGIGQDLNAYPKERTPLTLTSFQSPDGKVNTRVYFLSSDKRPKLQCLQRVDGGRFVDKVVDIGSDPDPNTSLSAAYSTGLKAVVITFNATGGQYITKADDKAN